MRRLAGSATGRVGLAGWFPTSWAPVRPPRHPSQAPRSARRWCMSWRPLGAAAVAATTAVTTARHYQVRQGRGELQQRVWGAVGGALCLQPGGARHHDRPNNVQPSPQPQRPAAQPHRTWPRPHVHAKASWSASSRASTARCRGCTPGWSQQACTSRSARCRREQRRPQRAAAGVASTFASAVVIAPEVTRWFPPLVSRAQRSVRL